tara:strand:- start:467 stop:1093 length:627 start_codon:yes stop_codon:yes gene_type:complete
MNIGSYHKTGTHLIKRIFNNYKETDRDQVFNFYWNYYLSQSSGKSVIVIRHPMEIIMSGVRYHQVSSEEWLHKPWQSPMGNPSGQSYSEIINGLSMDKKIIFEMENTAIFTIRRMLYDFTYRENTLFFQLEELYDESNVRPLSKRIAKFSGLDENYLEKAIREAMSKKYNATTKVFAHTYKRHFKPVHYELFHKLFPSVTLEVLGYLE